MKLGFKTALSLKAGKELPISTVKVSREIEFGRKLDHHRRDHERALFRWFETDLSSLLPDEVLLKK